MIDPVGDGPATQSTSSSDSGPVSAPLSGHVARCDTVIFTDLEDTVVMLDTDKGEYYELDAVGTRIWHLLAPEPTVDALIRTLTQEYDVDADTCRHEATAFLAELVALGLVRVTPEAENPDGR